VWAKKEIFIPGGLTLTLVGLVLASMSVWTNVQIKTAAWEMNLEEEQARTTALPVIS
jgi:hypothetical protein